MTPKRPETVPVYVDLPQFDEPAPMGSLRCQTSRSGEIFSFLYDETWLKHPAAFTFDPDLALVVGPQYPVLDRVNFGIFLDSSPDRWGRLLMQKRENLRARKEGRRARSLTDWDFLLGVHDETRLGALRFWDPDSGRKSWRQRFNMYFGFRTSEAGLWISDPRFSRSGPGCQTPAP